MVDGDGLRDLFRRRGASVIVTGGPARHPSTAELLDAVERAASPEVIILPNDKATILAADQVQPLTEVTVRVAPTRTIPEGIAALAAVDEEQSAEVNARAITAATAAIRSGSITRAVRDAQSDTGPIRRGDWLALTPDGLLAVADSAQTAAQELLTVLVDDRAESVTIIAGTEAEEPVIEGIEAWAGERWPILETSVVVGGQALYPYLVGVATRGSIQP